MAATEEELPEELDKLQITPNSIIMPQDKLHQDYNLPLALNPFFGGDVKSVSTQAAADVQRLASSSITPLLARCRCRTRRASESVLLDELKHSADTTVDPIDSLRTTSGVLKQSLKKYTSSTGSRKLLLREPVLKALQTCLHPQSNVRRKLLSSDVICAGAQGFDFNNQGNEVCALVGSKGMSDFRDLIEECRNLLTEDVDFSGRLNQMSLCNRSSKNFTTMQTQQTHSSSKLRNHRTYQKQQVPSRTKTKSGSGGCVSELNVDDPHQLNALTQPPSNSQRSGLSTNLSPEHAVPAVSHHTSCSQQASNTAAATAPSDDVTIDELASYFDTFVHIPKKMSSMAEMMYI